MLEKLKEIALRYEDLQAQLADPGVYGDAVRLRDVTRELKELEPIVAAYHAWRAAQASRADARPGSAGTGSGGVCRRQGGM